MYQVYQVMYGDTIDSIINKFNTNIDELKSLNDNLNIEAGKYIVVPNKANSYFISYIVKRGDSLYAIARNNNISVDDLSAINGLNKGEYIYPNQEILIPNNGVKVYVTKENDTMDVIKNRFNKSYEEILNQNKTIYLVPDQLIVSKD